MRQEEPLDHTRDPKNQAEPGRLFELQVALENLESVNATSNLLCYEAVKLLEPMLESARRAEASTAVEKLEWEMFLFSLHPMTLWSEWTSKYRLACTCCQPGKEDEASRITREALQYFKDRLKQARNPVLRARYAHILWDRRTDSGLPAQEGADFGRDACSEYLLAASAALDTPKGQFSAGFFLDWAMSVAIELQDTETAQKVVESMAGAVGTAAKPEYRACATRVAQTLLEVRNRGVGRQAVANEVLESVAKELEKLAGTPMRYLDQSQSCLKTLAQLYLALEDRPRAHVAKERLAATWVFQADFMQPWMMLRAEWYETAAKLYSETGNKERVGTLKSWMRRANREAERQGEYKPITASAEFDVGSVLEAYVRDEPAESLGLLARSDHLLPTEDTVRKQLAVESGEPTLLDFINQMQIKGGRKAAVTRDVLERKRLQLSQARWMVASAHIFAVVTPVLATLRTQKGLNAQGLLAFLAEPMPLPSDLMGLVRAGLNRYFDGDLTSAVYLLTPALERVLRETLEQYEIDVTPPRRGAYQESTLGSMLKKGECAELLGERVTAHLKFVLTDEAEGGLNLRNDVAHGILGPGECDQTKADLLIHLHLILSRFAQRPDA